MTFTTNMPIGSSESVIAAPVERLRHGRAKRFLKRAIGFWSGETRGLAWLLTAAFVGLLLVNLLVSLGINRWNRFFFDALERRDVDEVMTGITLILGLAAAAAVVMVATVHARMRLQLFWRRWLVQDLVGRWLRDRRFYKLSVIGSTADNPEARISDDVRLSVDLIVDFAGGVINAVLLASSFIVVLWIVGGSLTVGGVTIPGYMVIACVLYSGATTWGMYLLGRPLVDRVEAKAAAEAQFRYELTRVKDSAETIALIGGDEDERQKLDTSFGALAQRWLAVIRQQGHMTWLSGSNAVLAPIVPLLLGAPNYLAGTMTLGSLMQAAAAFVAVQSALNWLADNALRLADWFASAQRVSELDTALENLDVSLDTSAKGDTINIGQSPDACIHLKDLSIAQHDGSVMIEDAAAVIAPGEKVLVKGHSGSGKSTLIRALAGLWPWGSGTILFPQEKQIAFIPQRAYFPVGTLRDALLYPKGDREVSDDAVQSVLVRCGLEHLITRLDQHADWSGTLSGGEQQRAAFARILLNPPDILIMDEPTSALDELSQFRLLEYMRDNLAETTVLHVAHRPGVEAFHTRELRLVESGTGAATTQDVAYHPGLTMFRRIWFLWRRGAMT